MLHANLNLKLFPFILDSFSLFILSTCIKVIKGVLFSKKIKGVGSSKVAFDVSSEDKDQCNLVVEISNGVGLG